MVIEKNMIKTVEEIKNQIRNKNITYIATRECSICGCVIGFEINDGHPFFDSNCDCTSFWSDPQHKTWQEVADFFNCNQPENNPNISVEFINKLNKSFGFESAVNGEQKWVM